MIELQGVSKVYARGGRSLHALSDVSLRIERGEMVALIGPSGSGKSTLLHLAAGLDLPTSGTVRVDGQATHELGDEALTLLRRRRIGLVFQFFNLVPNLTVFENVALPLLLDGQARGAVARRVDGLLERVGLASRAADPPGELSGGEMQRVALARALAAGPALLLADEPTGNLDSESGRALLDLLREMWQREHVTIVMVTHDAVAASHAQRTLRLRDGRLED